MTDAPAPADAKPSLPFIELVAMVASLVALHALAIDLMLPALGLIGDDLGVAHDNDRQLVIVAYLLFAGVSQLFFGPLTDRFGRRAVILWALAGYIVGAALCVVASTFSLLLAARAFQGATTAAARVVAVAVVRDLMAGRRMAEVMSLAMTIFMIVPIVAPGIGQLVLLVAPWRGVFFGLLIYGVAVGLWVTLRLPETLPPERRTPLRPLSVARAYWLVVRTRVSVGYTMASGLVFGALFGFISSSEQVLAETFKLGRLFPLAFACVAAALALATITNSRLVGRIGMRRLSHGALIAFTALNVVHAAVALTLGETIWSFLAFTMAAFFMFGLMGPNFNALVMEPLGAIAGTASAAYGFATTSVSAVLGGIAGRFYDGTSAPLTIAFAVLGASALLVVIATERGRLFAAHAPEPAPAE